MSPASGGVQGNFPMKLVSIVKFRGQAKLAKAHLTAVK